MNLRDSLLAALVACLWGFNFIAIDWGMDGVPPLLFLAIRFVVVLLPAIFFVRRPDVPWRTILLVGAFMSLGQFSFLYLSMAAGLSPGLAALVLQAQVIFTILIAAGALRELPTSTQLAGAAIGSAGLVVVALGRGGDTPVLALLLCLAGALSWGVGNVLSRASGAKSGLGLTVWSALVVPLPALALSVVVDGPAEVVSALAGLSWQAMVATLYTAVLASLVGYSIFNALLGRNASSAVAPWVLLAPIVAMASAALLLGELPTRLELLGGTIMLAGVLVALTPRRSAGRGLAGDGHELSPEPSYDVGEEAGSRVQ